MSIEVNDLTMRYGSFTALDRLSFTVERAGVLGLLGPNGAGKTTAMRILTTYLFPTSGSAVIHGFDVTKEPQEVRKLIGYLPETAPLYMDMLIDEYLRFVAEARNISGKALKDRLDWVIEACQLKPVLKHRLSELSKGYRQRAGLAQALIHDPKVLILDEPTSGLDPLQILGIRDLIRELSKEKVILFSTHILQEVETMADRIVIINEGKVVEQGSRKELEDAARSKDPTAKDSLSLEEIFIRLLKPNSNRALHA